MVYCEEQFSRIYVTNISLLLTGIWAVPSSRDPQSTVVVSAPAAAPVPN
jgi:hypothetical protein